MSATALGISVYALAAALFPEVFADPLWDIWYFKVKPIFRRT